MLWLCACECVTRKKNLFEERFTYLIRLARKTNSAKSVTSDKRLICYGKVIPCPRYCSEFDVCDGKSLFCEFVEMSYTVVSLDGILFAPRVFDGVASVGPNEKHGVFHQLLNVSSSQHSTAGHSFSLSLCPLFLFKEFLLFYNPPFVGF